MPEPTITTNGWNSDNNGYIHPTDVNGGEHIWALEWSPTFLIYYLDGIELRRISGNGFDRAMGIILNTALFNWTDDKMPGVTKVNNSVVMPQTFEVDYVKVYKLSTTDCGSDITYSSLNNSTLYNNVKRNITISGASPIAVPANSAIILRAANEITINGDFSVPLGSEFGALISACY